MRLAGSCWHVNACRPAAEVLCCLRPCSKLRSTKVPHASNDEGHIVNLAVADPMQYRVLPPACQHSQHSQHCRAFLLVVNLPKAPVEVA